MRALVLAAFLLTAAPAFAAPTTLSESFDDISTLSDSGWVRTNESSPRGETDWYQGLDYQFASHSGTDSYIAANFNNADFGGTISNWLITPLLSVTAGSTFSFYMRGADDDGFADHLGVYVAHGDTTTTSSFTQLGTTITATKGDWSQVSFTFNSNFDGRFAIRYVGDADSSDYLGIDDVALTTAPVPEPGEWAMMAAGLGLVGAVARRKRR